jgi:uridine nucleosidase
MLTSFHNTDTPVYAGSAKPLIKQPFYAPGIHGSNGLGGISIPDPSFETKNAIGEEDTMLDALYSAIEAYDSQLALVAVGPLTNIAKLFLKYPQAKQMIKVLSIMGGGVGVYNLETESEFNIYNDPKAANVIFEDPELQKKTILSPLDVTHKVICTADIQDRILNKPHTTPLRQMVYDLLTFFANAYKTHQDFKDGPPIHDQVAVFVLLSEYAVSSIGLEIKRLKIHVEEAGEHEGKLICQADGDIRVVLNLDVKAFWEDALEVLSIADDLIK